MRHTNRKESQRPAAVLPLVTICLVGLFGFVALAIDIGMMAVARTQSQSAADAGALAGARTLNGKSGNNRTNAEAEAREAAQANEVLNANVTAAQVTSVKSGVYRYNTGSQRFVAEFGSAPTSLEAYGVMQVVITTQQPTYFGRVLGVNSMQVSARATAVHRPRDVAISLDFSGSMKFSSEFNYPSLSGSGSSLTGGLNGDTTFPQFGPWKMYSPASTTPMRFSTSAYQDSGGELHAANNLTMTTPHGSAIVNNFQTTAAASGTNAFVYNGDLTAGSFNISNSPVCTPTPSTWTSQYASSYAGDRWPLNKGVSSTNPSLAEFAKHVADLVYSPIPSITNSTRDATWETLSSTGGYDMSSLTFKNGTFKGYSMGPGYYGKSFYMWPPDPRWTANADPTNISTTNPIQDTSNRYMADWRKRFFLYPSASSGTKGAIMDDNSKLFDPTTKRWANQGVSGTVLYVPNYDAILKWLKSGPKTLPSALRAGRVLYYDAIPDAIPMNWQTGVISSGATTNERFWKEYIDFVIGSGRHPRNQTLYGDNTTNISGANTFGSTLQITAKASLTGSPAPYMNYRDCPVHPRLHTWFGPLTMLGFLSINSYNVDYNWMAGTTAEAQTWQLKAGIRSALDDIRNNHPNDLATLNFWSSHNGFNTPRVAMGKDYDKMQNCLYYPFSLINNLGTVTSEKRPYKNGTQSTTNPSGLDPANYASDIPLGDGGTNPSMGLMLSYNQFNWVNSYTGRNGATKMVILETDGVANQKINGTFSSITSGRKEWTSITNGGSATSPSNGHPEALDPAISMAWLICQDSTGSKAWPTFPAYTNGLSGVATAGAPTRWSTVPSNGIGFSTTRNPARIHTIAFGELFESTTTSGLKTRALEFLRNLQIAGGTSAAGATSIESYKIITGTSTQRIDSLKQALERIMQGGIQVALVE